MILSRPRGDTQSQNALSYIRGGNRFFLACTKVSSRRKKKKLLKRINFNFYSKASVVSKEWVLGRS